MKYVLLQLLQLLLLVWGLLPSLACAAQCCSVVHVFGIFLTTYAALAANTLGGLDDTAGYFSITLLSDLQWSLKRGCPRQAITSDSNQGITAHD